jgi:hypothetical protein
MIVAPPADEETAPPSREETTVLPPVNEDHIPPATDEMTATPPAKKAATPAREKRRSTTGSRNGSDGRGGSTSMNPIPAAEALNGADRGNGSTSKNLDMWQQYAAQRRGREEERDEDEIGG